MATNAQKEVEALKAQANELLAQAAAKVGEVKAETVARINKILGDTGFTLSELYPKAPRKAVAKQFRNPADPTQEWSGRGKRPAWLNDAIAAGKSLSDFKIT